MNTSREPSRMCFTVAEFDHEFHKAILVLDFKMAIGKTGN